MRLTAILLSVLLVFGCAKSSNNGTPSSPQQPQAPAPSSGNESNKGQHNEFNFQKFAVIREFGGTDNAALFGVLTESGKFEISSVVGPSFLKTYKVGMLTQSSMDKLFLNTSQPLSQADKENLLAKFSGATVVYTEGYNGNLCNLEETKYEIIATGKVDATQVEVAFQFEALPNPSGSCEFHIFGIAVRYLN